jgi:hypothetical protein
MSQALFGIPPAGSMVSFGALQQSRVAPPFVHRSVEFRLADAHPFFLSVLLLEISAHLFGLLDFALFFLFQATLYSPLFQEDLFPAFIVGKEPFQAEYAATRVVFIFRDGPAATVHNTAVYSVRTLLGIAVAPNARA